MHSMTTQSGQARSRLIAMFSEAQMLARRERERAAAARSLIACAVADSTVREAKGDHVLIEMPCETWDALRKGA